MNKIFISRPIFLLAISSLIVYGYSFRYGFYDIYSLILITLTFFLCVIITAKKNLVRFSKLGFRNATQACLTIFLALSYLHYGGIYQNNYLQLVDFSKLILALCLTLNLLVLFGRPLLKNSGLSQFWLMVFLASILRIFLIWSSPSLTTDVHGIQMFAPKVILDGNNPYSSLYYFPWQSEPLDVYPYGPVNIFLNFPVVLLLKDSRYVQVFSEIGVALLVYLVLRKTELKKKSGIKVSETLPLIFLFNPRSLFILEQAWVDPVLVFLIFLFACLLFVWRREALSFVVLGLAIATKQYAIMILPFLFVGGFLKLRNFLLATTVSFLVSLPFLFWNFKDFFRDVVLFNVLIQESRFDSLSWNSFLHNNTGFEIPMPVILVAEIALLLFLSKKQQKNLGSGVMFSTGVLLLFTYLIYRLAFIHYYYFAGSMIFLSMVLLFSEHSVKSARKS